MTDYSFGHEKINELAIKYKSASSFEKKNIKNEISSLFAELYENNEIHIRGIDENIFINELTDLIYGLSKKNSSSILDTFPEGDFFAYMITSIKNSDKKKYARQKKEQINSEIVDSESDKFSMELVAEKRNDAEIFVLSILQMEFVKHLTKKQYNTDRQMYTKLFWTSHITKFCKLLYDENVEYPIRKTLMNNETTIFKNMNIDFLDHIMEELCRCISEISESEYKKNKCFGINQNPEDRISPMFDAKVYKSFLKDYLNKSVSDAAISQQRKYYYESINKLRP